MKESTFLAGGGKGEPTIITPKQYRQRFLSAMERYFPLVREISSYIRAKLTGVKVPDRWMKYIDNEDECNDLWPDW